MMDEQNMLYITRLLTGIASGIICGLLKLIYLRGVFIAIVAYCIHYLIVKKYLNVEEQDLKRRGLAEYLGLWLTLWTLVYNL